MPESFPVRKVEYSFCLSSGFKVALSSRVILADIPVPDLFGANFRVVVTPNRFLVGEALELGLGDTTDGFAVAPDWLAGGRTEEFDGLAHYSWSKERWDDMFAGSKETLRRGVVRVMAST